MMRSIDLCVVNHLVLRKHHLAEDSKIDDVVQIVRDVGGLHATGSTVPYLSLFARTRSFLREGLDEELYERRSLGKIRCIRKTLYILTREMIPIAYAAARRVVEKASKKYIEFRGVSPDQYEDASKTILAILKGREMTASEIKRILKTQLDVSAILYLMCDQGLLIRSKPEKGWRDRNHRYSLFNEYFPDIDLTKMDEAEARTLLIKNYLCSFGPVTENDISWWTGLEKRQVRHALNNLQEQSTHIRISDLERDFIMLRSDEDLLKDMSLPQRRVVNLLPTLDPYLMGYKERGRYLNYEHYDKVFDRSGNATSTILLDGRVGVWDFAEDTEPTVKIFLFEEVGGSVLREIRLKARRIGRFIADKEVKIKECDSVVPLTQRPAGAVMSPLRGC